MRFMLLNSLGVLGLFFLNVYIYVPLLSICPADGSSTRGGSTSVRGRVRSPHISGGERWL